MAKSEKAHSTRTLQWLVREATHPHTHPQEIASFAPTQDEDHSKEEVDRREISVQASTLLADREDPFGLAPQLLTYVLHQLRTHEALNGVVALLQPPPVLPSSPSIRLLSLCQFSQLGIVIDPGRSAIVLAYSEVLESLIGSGNAFHAAVYKSLRLQFRRMLEKPQPWMSLLGLYAVLLVSEARRAASDLVALDLFSESLESILNFNQHCDVDRTATVVLELLFEALDQSVDAHECLQAFVMLQPKESRLPQLSLEQCTSFLHKLMAIPSIIPQQLLDSSRWFRRLWLLDPTGTASTIFSKALFLGSSQGEQHVASTLGNAIENALAAKVEMHRLNYLYHALERSEFATIQEFCMAIQKTSDVKTMESLATRRVLTGADMGSVQMLLTHEADQMVSPELLRTRLNHWQDLNAIHRGFTSRLISAKRGPFREPPDLVQFAIDVGGEKSVRYFNAKDPNLFPGKGFLVTRLQLAKCFAPQTSPSGKPSVDPFEIYKTAWPTLAEAIDRFNDAEFIFLRGCVMISCKHRDYLLPAGNGEHYSLVVFNDHFRNPFQEVAYLVPNQGVAALLARTQIPYADFVGFDQRRPDLNSQLHSPRSFLDHPLIKDKAIDVGGVSAILSGFEGHLPRIGERLGLREIREKMEELSQRIAAHNQSIQDWESKNHRYHLSQQGQEAMGQLSVIGRSLELEQSRLYGQQALIFDQVESRIWKLVDKYTAMHKLLCIAHAYWHRGYTAGKLVSTSHISEQYDFEEADSNSEYPRFESLSVQSADADSSTEPDLELQPSSEVVSNRNSLRMLVQAYEWHSMRENPNALKEDFPVLVMCDATELGSQPELDVYIDTYDMKAYLDNQPIQLSQGKMTSDDELFWFATIFPRVVDQQGMIRDLRFYPRASLGLG